MLVQERRNTEVNLNNRIMHPENAAVKVATSSSSFAAMLEEDREIRKYSLELDELKRQIYDAGNALEKSANIKDFYRFRDLITSLTEKVVKHAYKVRIKFQVISKINEELDALYREIMREQKNHIAIANKMMRLKGLVLNLMS
ncbi:YaaR family protein [uncultured Brachyspira sp.]|uniref:YaaR family protein n=1 Tax=uncultured Brachyspira sp. TaxID=221953 RepID=UPI0025D33207|nr:YaaR family protein [uncultured Brachyspira sp.]